MGAGGGVGIRQGLWGGDLVPLLGIEKEVLRGGQSLLRDWFPSW